MVEMAPKTSRELVRRRKPAVARSAIARIGICNTLRIVALVNGLQSCCRKIAKGSSRFPVRLCPRDADVLQQSIIKHSQQLPLAVNLDALGETMRLSPKNIEAATENI